MEDCSGTEDLLQVSRQDQPDHPGQEQEQGHPGCQGLRRGKNPCKDSRQTDEPI